MPVVPVPQRRTQVEALPNARISTAVVDTSQSQAQLNNAIEGMGDAMQKKAQEQEKVHREEKQKADDLAATEAWTKLHQKKKELIWDPKAGAMTRKGKDAFGVSEEYGKQFRDYGDEVEKGLSNSDQQELFRKMRMREEVDFDDHLQKHTFQEVRSFEDSTVKAGMKTAHDDAIIHYKDPRKVEEAIKLQEGLLRSHAARNGMGGAEYEMLAKDAKSKIHAGVIERALANGEDMQASAYYKRVKDQLGGDEATTIEKALEEGSFRGESQRQSAVIVKTSEDMPAALERARAIKDPKLQDAVIERVKDYYTLQSAAKKAQQDQLFNHASDLVEQTKERPDPVTWARLDMDQRNKIDARIEKLTKGIEPVENGPDYYRLKTKASFDETKTEFLQTNLMEYRGKVTSSELSKLIDLQTAMRNKDNEGADKLLDGFRSKNAIVLGALKSAGIDPKATHGSEDAQASEKMLQMVDRQLMERQRQTGKKATNEDVQEIVDNLMIEGITEKGFFFDTKKRAFQVEEGETFEIDVATIPVNEKKKIAEALTKRGEAVTDDAIIDWYGRMQVKKRGN